MKKLSRKFYPFMVAIYPVLALWNYNITYVDFSSAFRSILLTVLATALMWMLLRVILKDWQKAGLMAALGMFLFFIYGHVYLILKEQINELARHRFLLMLFGGLFLVIGWFVVRKLKNVGRVEVFFSITSGLLVGLSIFQLGWHQYLVFKASRELQQNLGSAVETQNQIEDLSLPDVYLIILDGYTRADVLNVFYDYDNSPFLNELTEMGFYIGRCSQSNYASTKLSLSSVMNLNYILEVLGDAKTLPPLESSVVNQTLDRLGYTTIAFENRARGHFDLDEDIHLSRNPLVFENMDLLNGITEFESMVIETSMLRLLFDMKGLLPELITGKVKDAEYYNHYLQTEFILDELGRLPEMEGPIFVFAHILVPHTPFVFSPTGDYKPSGAQGTVIGYRNNVEYLNSKLPDVLREIIENSEVQPIIVIMGDHGPMGKTVTREQRMAILNAYYVNEETQAFLYEEITPVNSFRVIFNQYFGTDYPLLEDVSYYKFKKNQVKEDSNSIEIPCGEGW